MLDEMGIHTDKLQNLPYLWNNMKNPEWYTHTLFFSYAQNTKLNTRNDEIEMKRHHISNRFKILLANSSEYFEIQAEVMCL